MQPAVFFDRDGVLNVDHGYVHHATDFDWIAGAREAIRLCNEKGYLVFVVTNQSGIGRGYYSSSDFNALCEWMRNDLATIGAHIDHVYHCPHHPEKGKGDFLATCKCRKPEPGMLLEACETYDVDKARSFLIGDKGTDIEAAERAGITGYLFTGGNLFDFVSSVLNEEF